MDVRTLAELPRSLADRAAPRVAFVDPTSSLTFEGLAEGTARVARGLAGLGVEMGTRVGFLTSDSVAGYEAILGTVAAGGVVLGVNWRLTAKEARFLLADGRASVVFVDRERLPRMLEMASDLPRLRHVLVLDAPGESGAIDYRAWRDAQSARASRVDVDEEAPAAQMYTSGTTGHPKGVMLPHRSFFAILRALRRAQDDWIHWSEQDVSLLALPAFHIGGLWWAMAGLQHAATAVVMPSFIGWRALEMIARYRVTKACFVPAMLQVLLSEPGCRHTDSSSLQHIVYGGSPIARSLLTEAMEVFRCRFAQIYGLTETGNTAVCSRHEAHIATTSDALAPAGRPYPEVSIEIRDETGRPLPLGETGEICIRSPANMLGYWNRPRATAATLVDGFVLTGDAGYLDADGHLFVCDRLKDMIIAGGEKVYPAEVESVLCEHPAVLEAAVLGVPDDRWGESVKALVVPRESLRVDVPSLLEFCRERLAGFKVPQSVEIRSSLPRTVSGKLKKHELRAPYWEGRERPIN